MIRCDDDPVGVGVLSQKYIRLTAFIAGSAGMLYAHSV